MISYDFTYRFPPLHQPPSWGTQGNLGDTSGRERTKRLKEPISHEAIDQIVQSSIRGPIGQTNLGGRWVFSCFVQVRYRVFGVYIFPVWLIKDS